jgi:hypothetical protein
LASLRTQWPLCFAPTRSRFSGSPGGVDSAQQIIVGATAATFRSESELSSWVGACLGDEESAGVNFSRRSPKGNRHLRRLLNQAANAGKDEPLRHPRPPLRLAPGTPSANPC